MKRRTEQHRAMILVRNTIIRTPVAAAVGVVGKLVGSQAVQGYLVQLNEAVRLI